MAQIFNTDQMHNIGKGAIVQKQLRAYINEALFSNPFNDNYIISSMPGLGKTYETLDALKNKPADEYVLFEGTASMPAFTIDVATAVYCAGGKHMTFVLDDCDLLFEDKNVNTAKKMFDRTRALKYNKNYRSLKGICSDLQFEALASFGSDDKSGFSIPLNNVTIIILTNRNFPTVNEVDATESGSSKESKLTDLYAIRRRTEYKEVVMDNKDLWGYVANVVLKEKICEKFIPNIKPSAKQQLINWCYSNWANVTERNLSLIEKMTKDMIRYPNDYLDIWQVNYL